MADTMRGQELRALVASLDGTLLALSRECVRQGVRLFTEEGAVPVPECGLLGDWYEERGYEECASLARRGYASSALRLYLEGLTGRRATFPELFRIVAGSRPRDLEGVR